MKIITTTTLTVLLLSLNSFAQSTRVVRPGSYNVPITEVQFTHNGSTITQTSEASGTLVNTNKAVDLNYVKIDDDGTIKTLSNFNSLGAAIVNNNFSGSVSGVGVYNEGSTVKADNQSSWEAAMVESGSNGNVLNYLYYDGARNVPSGSDFDMIWTKGWESTDFLLVAERNGNTCFALTPLDSNGDVISAAYKLQFGKCNGSVRSEYDWNIGYAPTNITNQPMVFTVIRVSEFNTSNIIFGFRIDNTGDADPKFFGLSDVTFEDNPNNPMMGGVSGTLFNDADGLVDNTVDGIGLESPDGNFMFAHLVNSSNVVVAITEIGADGHYEFLNLESDAYDVVLSTTEGTVGQSAPTVTVPTNWAFTGENLGTGSGSDGTTNGILLNITVNGTFVENANFGIEKRPDSESKSKLIDMPVFQSTVALSSANAYPQLAGTDNEDGVQGSGNNLVVTDTAGMNGNKLFYNGVIVVPNQTINNFDPTLLEVKYDGLNSSNFAFSYFFKDAAGLDDLTPATYNINWTGALPVEWLGFGAQFIASESMVKVKWATAQELNNSHFVVLRSDNGIDFEEITTENGQGDYVGITRYEINDYTIVEGNTYYYKVKQVDFDGKSSETNTVAVDLSDNAKKISMYPNPFAGNVEININTPGFERVTVQDMTGRVFVNETGSNQTNSLINIETIDWPTGIYFFTVSSGGSTTTQKLIKSK